MRLPGAHWESVLQLGTSRLFKLWLLQAASAASTDL